MLMRFQNPLVYVPVLTPIDVTRISQIWWKLLKRAKWQREYGQNLSRLHI